MIITYVMAMDFDVYLTVEMRMKKTCNYDIARFELACGDNQMYSELFIKALVELYMECKKDSLIEIAILVKEEYEYIKTYCTHVDYHEHDKIMLS